MGFVLEKFADYGEEEFIAKTLGGGLEFLQGFSSCFVAGTSIVRRYTNLVVGSVYGLGGKNAKNI